jgi:hypothetical protein
VALYTDDRVTLTGDGFAERVRDEIAGARYLTALRVQPALGRNFLPEEDLHPDGPRGRAPCRCALETARQRQPGDSRQGDPARRAASIDPSEALREG